MGKLNEIIITIIVMVMILFPGVADCQITKIMGKITDARTGEALPFVNVIIQGTTIGTLTDFHGNYSLQFKVPGDSIRVSLMGYLFFTQKFKQNHFQTLDFKMMTTDIQLQEVTIVYKGNPAEIILQKIIRNKEINSLQSFDNYKYEAYTKVELDANNIDGILNDKLFEQFDFIFEYVDTSIINGKSYLPVFITESKSEIYFRKSPKSKKEIIKATRSSGLEDMDFSQLLGNLAQEVDIYQNHILLFEKNFISPIADFGLGFYKYYLVDSLYMGNRRAYHIMFKPRHRQTLSFTGNLWVADTSFAILKIDMRVTPDANLNFINDLVIRQEFERMENKYWMLVKDYVVADFNLLQKTMKTLGFFGHSTSVYSNFSFDRTENTRFFSMPANVIVEDDAKTKDNEYWNDSRPEPLSRSEQVVYAMTDSITKIPLFQTYQDVIYGLFTGYVSWGKLEIGKWFSVYSFNENEGNRFKIIARTGNNFSKKVQLQGFLAYGTRDMTYKYGADIIYLYSKNPRRGFQLYYKYDVEQLGSSLMAINTDNIVSSLFHRGSNDKLSLSREYRLTYEHEWFLGFSNTLKLTHRELFPLQPDIFIIHPYENKTDSMNQIFTTEARIDFRISFRERYISGQFYRYNITSPFPIIQLTYAYGFPNILNSDFEYHRLGLSLKQWFNFSIIGWSKYIIETGKIWGKLPFPMLKIHEGNQSFFFDEYASNLMNYYEFVSDEYINGFFTHHFDGLLFNRIPWLRELKWREVAHVRGVYGTLSPINMTFSEFPKGMRNMGKEIYWEAGAGIENIFKIFRVDAVWRLSHLNDLVNLKVPKFGIFVAANFSF